MLEKKYTDRGVTETHDMPAEARKKRVTWLNLGLLVIIMSCANDLFKLVPWYHLPGAFNINDVGLFLLLAMFVSIVLNKRAHLLFNNGFSILILLYLFFVLIQVSMASFNFNQSILSGLIGVRHQFYYLSFFVFLALFDNLEKIEHFINAIFYLGVFLIVVGTINHYGFTIFHHKWAEGHQIRFGVVRAYIPGMVIVSMGLIWAVIGWTLKNRNKLKSTFFTLLFLYAHVLRQTRANLVAAAVVIVMILIKKKKYKAMIIAGFAIVVVASIVEVTMEENILLAPFVSTVKDIREGTGSWEGRLKQLEVDIQVFMKYPYMGSGTSVIRLSENVVSQNRLSEMAVLAKSDDLGYGHWIKAYGIPGIVWLMVMYWLLYRYYQSVKNIKDPQIEPLVLLIFGYISFVIISFITLPHFMREDLIMLLCMIIAILVKVHQFKLNAIKHLS